METLDDIDNISKNIVQEIIRDCHAAGVEVDIEFCIYYVKLCTLDPMWKIWPGCQLNRENIVKFVQCSDHHLQKEDNLIKHTLQIQHYFLKHTLNRKQIIESAREKLAAVLEPLLEELLDFNIDDICAISQSKYFKKYIYYITMIAGMGDPSHIWVYKEAELALDSVLADSNRKQYLAADRNARMALMDYSIKLVTGIRLFNLHSKRNVADFHYLPKILETETKKSENMLNEELSELHESTYMFTKIIEANYIIETDPDGEHTLIADPALTSEFLDVTKLLLGLSIQHEEYIRKTILNINQIQQNCMELTDKYNGTMEQIDETTKFRVAIPCVQILPLFVETANIWESFQDEAIVLSKYNEVMKYLHKSIKDLFKQGKYQKIFAYGMSFCVLKRKKITPKFVPINCKIISRNVFLETSNEPLQYLGMCTWYFVESEGGITMGNFKLGVLQWKNRNYIFSGFEAMTTFDKDPDRYINQALELIRKLPNLINLFGVYDDLEAVREIEPLYNPPVEQIIMESVSVQTDTHPIDSYINPDYDWNIWDLYRKAIKLANISMCTTRSYQTIRTHYRVSSRVQTFERRDKESQTMQESHSNVPTLSNYIFGLRGRKDDVQHIIELTRPVKE